MPTLFATRRRGAIVAVAAALLLAAAAGSVFLSSDGSSTASDEPVVPSQSDDRPLPVESFELFDGESTTLAAFEGKPLVINFFASWCPACIAELPEFQAVNQARGDEVTFLGLANSDQRSAALALAEQVGLTYQLGDDPGGDLFRELDLFAMPSTVFVTADGRVHEVFGGQLDEAALESRLDELVKVE